MIQSASKNLRIFSGCAEILFFKTFYDDVDLKLGMGEYILEVGNYDVDEYFVMPDTGRYYATVNETFGFYFFKVGVSCYSFRSMCNK